MEPTPEPQWDPSSESEDDPEDDEEDLPDPDDDELVEFDDDDPGTVSNDILEQFNNPDTYDRVEFNGTADIVLQEKSFAYGDEVTLKAKVSGVDISYRLVWEANDGDERGWYTISSGLEYTFTVKPENIDRGYRVVLFAVD